MLSYNETTRYFEWHFLGAIVHFQSMQMAIDFVQKQYGINLLTYLN